jgi:hypothetical protein
MEPGVTVRANDDLILLDVRTALTDRFNMMGVDEAARKTCRLKLVTTDLTGVPGVFLDLSS